MLHRLASEIMAECEALQAAGAPKATVANLRAIAMAVHREGHRLEPEVTPGRLAPVGAPDVRDPVLASFGKAEVPRE